MSSRSSRSSRVQQLVPYGNWAVILSNATQPSKPVPRNADERNALADTLARESKLSQIFSRNPDKVYSIGGWRDQGWEAKFKFREQDTFQDIVSKSLGWWDRNDHSTLGMQTNETRLIFITQGRAMCVSWVRSHDDGKYMDEILTPLLEKMTCGRSGFDHQEWLIGTNHKGKEGPQLIHTRWNPNSGEWTIEESECVGNNWREFADEWMKDAPRIIDNRPKVISGIIIPEARSGSDQRRSYL